MVNPQFLDYYNTDITVSAHAYHVLPSEYFPISFLNVHIHVVSIHENRIFIQAIVDW